MLGVGVHTCDSSTSEREDHSEREVSLDYVTRSCLQRQCVRHSHIYGRKLVTVTKLKGPKYNLKIQCLYTPHTTYCVLLYPDSRKRQLRFPFSVHFWLC